MIKVLWVAVSFAVIVAASPGSAHMPIEGVGGFRGGLLHPLLVPAHGLSILALGLFIGPQQHRFVMYGIFVVALAIGLIAIAIALDETPAETVLLAAAALGGLHETARGRAAR